MTGLGHWTLTDLSQTDALFFPRGNDLEPIAGQSGAPVFSRTAARMSLELAAAAYSFDIRPWTDAGYQDFSFVVDGEMYTTEGESAVLTDLAREWTQYFAKKKASKRGPITQVRGILRQTGGTVDTCKAIVMAKKMDGKIVIAVGFMGTGGRIFDWVSNLRLRQEDGLHQGFLQLTRTFLSLCPEIRFPHLASSLGVKKLTLQDILCDMKHQDSPYLLWAAGHSQGAAEVQIFFDRLMHEGVRREKLCGWGFASPSVASRGRKETYQSYPITHILNADDVIPRVGASVHLGKCLVYTFEEGMRAQVYRPAEGTCFEDCRRLLGRLHNTEQSLLFVYAFLQNILTLSAEEMAQILQGMLSSLPDSLTRSLDGRLDSLFRMIGRRAEQAYLDVTGKDSIPDVPLAYWVSEQKKLMDQYGAIPLIRQMIACVKAFHRLAVEDDGKSPLAPYLMIVRRGMDDRKAFGAPLPFRQNTPQHARRKRQSVQSGKFHTLTQMKLLRKYEKRLTKKL